MGFDLAFPAILLRSDYRRLMHRDGEVWRCCAARRSGHCLYFCRRSPDTGLEDVKAASNGPVWYQLYLLGGREAESGDATGTECGFLRFGRNH